MEDGFVAYAGVASGYEVDFAREIWKGGWIEGRHCEERKFLNFNTDISAVCV